MPKSITFFSRGKTPIYVNYVIAHNTVGRPQTAVRRPQFVALLIGELSAKLPERLLFLFYKFNNNHY